jgi:hypothetical protein
MNNLEEKIWAYIDGSCSAEEEQAIALLIEQDEDYRKAYQELSALNEQLTLSELDEPSMAFTYNVMGTIRAEQAQKPLKTHINPFIIKGIAAFFILLIVAGIAVVFMDTNWSVNSTTVNTFKLPDLKNYFSRPVLNAFLFFDTVLGLFLLDSFLRRKRYWKHI